MEPSGGKPRANKRKMRDHERQITPSRHLTAKDLGQKLEETGTS